MKIGDNMTTGTVKWFNSRKGYGFIQPENGGKDVFVHITKLEEKGLRKLQKAVLCRATFFISV